MQISAPLPSLTRAVFADWVELQVVVSNTPISEANLIRSQAALSESEHGDRLSEIDLEPVDEEIIESGADELSQRVYEELEYRANALGALYPFTLEADYGKWVLTRRATEEDGEKAAHAIYIRCLLISAMRSPLLPVPEQHDLLIQSSKVLQIDSYLTAAEIVGGQAYWFGFPRPEGTPMLDAVKDLVEKMGMGVAPENRPLGVSPHSKDGTVDIVAWRGFLDGQPGGIVAYGQVASGRNWDTKPIKSYLHGQFLSWFEKPPSQKYLELLFIPFLQHQKLGEERQSEYREAAHEQARLREMDFGIVIDRLRLTELMAASKLGSRYDKVEFDSHESEAESWKLRAIAYAGSKSVNS